MTESEDGPHGLTATGIFSVCLALLGLLALTIGFAYVPLGRWNLIVAMTISTAKLLLIAFYFMHMRRSGKTIWLFSAAGFFWVAILIGLSLTDYLTRWGAE